VIFPKKISPFPPFVANFFLSTHRQKLEFSLLKLKNSSIFELSVTLIRAEVQILPLFEGRGEAGGGIWTHPLLAR
jgi:hypothetical protein